jgi:hypothetical protein
MIGPLRNTFQMGQMESEKPTQPTYSVLQLTFFYETEGSFIVGLYLNAHESTYNLNEVCRDHRDYM